ncbi:MAG: signal peptidase I [Prevotella sp.]|nr:signal peptidase I [Prevotella sp.]
MRQAFKAFIAFGIALLIVFAVRAYAFTIYTVPLDIHQMLRRGDRVMVNRLSQANPKVGDMVVFNRGVQLIGRVEALPGDTVRVGHNRFVIPESCCNRCCCPDCKLYMLNIGTRHALVYKHQMVGKARRLFHLPF